MTESTTDPDADVDQDVDSGVDQEQDQEQKHGQERSPYVGVHPMSLYDLLDADNGDFDVVEEVSQTILQSFIRRELITIYPAGTLQFTYDQLEPEKLEIDDVFVRPPQYINGEIAFQIEIHASYPTVTVAQHQRQGHLPRSAPGIENTHHILVSPELTVTITEGGIAGSGIIHVKPDSVI